MYNETGYVCFACKKGLACSKHPLVKKKFMKSDAIGKKMDRIKDDDDESDLDRREDPP